MTTEHKLTWTDHVQRNGGETVRHMLPRQTQTWITRFRNSMSYSKSQVGKLPMEPFLMVLQRRPGTLLTQHMGNGKIWLAVSSCFSTFQFSGLGSKRKTLTRWNIEECQNTCGLKGEYGRDKLWLLFSLETWKQPWAPNLTSVPPWSPRWLLTQGGPLPTFLHSFVIR